MKYVNSKSEMPSGSHFAVVIFSSVYVPGDARSESRPGHGYPAHSEDKAQYIAFASEDEWRAWIEKEMVKPYNSTNFVAMRADTAIISNHTKVYLPKVYVSPSSQLD